MNTNTITISGNLCADVELKYLQDGKAVGDIRLASTAGFGDKKKSIFTDITIWGKQAEATAQYCRKGSQVVVTGRLDQDEWDDKQTGKKRTKLKIIANQIEFVGARQDGQQSQPANQQPQANSNYNAPATNSYGQQMQTAQNSQGQDIPF